MDNSVVTGHLKRLIAAFLATASALTIGQLPALATFDYVPVSGATATVNGLNGDLSSTSVTIDYILDPGVGPAAINLYGIICVFDGSGPVWDTTQSTGVGDTNGLSNTGSFDIAWPKVNGVFPDMGITKVVVVANSNVADLPDLDWCNGSIANTAETASFVPIVPLEVWQAPNLSSQTTLYSGETIALKPALPDTFDVYAATLAGSLCVQLVDSAANSDLGPFLGSTSWELTSDEYGFLAWSNVSVPEVLKVSLGTCDWVFDNPPYFDNFVAITPEVTLQYSSATRPEPIADGALTGTYDPTDDSINLSWTAPADNGSALTGYHICVDGCENAVGTPDANDALAGGDATSAKFTHPVDGTNHTFGVYAKNAVGYSLSAPVVTVDVPAKSRITFDLGPYLQSGDSNPSDQYAPVGSTLALPSPTYGDLTFLGWSNGGADPVTSLNVGGDTDLIAVFSPNTDATMISLSQDGTEIALKDGNTYFANWDRFTTSTDFTLVLPPKAYVSSRVDIRTGPVFSSLTLTNDTFTLAVSNFCNTYPCSGSYADHTEITFTVTSEDGQNSTDYTLRVARPIDWNNFWIWYQDPSGGNSAITTDVYGSQYESINCPQGFTRDGYELVGFVDANDSSTTYACDQILLINFNLSIYASWNELPPVLPPDPTPTSINIYEVSYSVADCSNLPGELCLTSSGVEYEPDNRGYFYISQFQSSVASWSVSAAVTDGVTSSVGIELNIQGATDFSYFTGSQTRELENAITQHCTNQALPSGCSIWTGVAVSTENSAQDQVDIYVNMLTFVGITSGATATITFSTVESSLASYMPSTLTTAMGWIDTPDVVDVTDANFSQSYWDSSYLQWGFEPGEKLPLLQDLTLVAGVQPEIQMNYYVGDELVYTQISYAYYMLDRPGDFPTTEISDLFYWHLAGSDQAVNPWAGNQIDYTESLNWYAVSFVDQMSLTLSEDGNGPLLSLDLTAIQDAHLDFSVSYEGICEGSDQWVEIPQPDFPWAYYLADLGAACSQVRAVVDLYKNDVFLETGNLLADIPITEPDQNQNQDNTSLVQSPSSPVEQISDPIVTDVTVTPELAMRQIGNKFRAALFNIVGAGKVQIIQNGREIGWVRAASSEDPKLRTADDGNRYFVRTRPLKVGVNTIKILIDGKVFSSTKFTLAS